MSGASAQLDGWHQNTRQEQIKQTISFARIAEEQEINQQPPQLILTI